MAVTQSAGPVTERRCIDLVDWTVRLARDHDQLCHLHQHHTRTRRDEIPSLIVSQHQSNSYQPKTRNLRYPTTYLQLIPHPRHFDPNTNTRNSARSRYNG